MVTDQKRLSTYILSLLDNGHDSRQIEAYLVEHGHDMTFVQEVVKETIRARKSHKLIKWGVIVVVGAIICTLCMLIAGLPYFHRVP